jgi:hypothetical protein
MADKPSKPSSHHGTVHKPPIHKRREPRLGQTKAAQAAFTDKLLAQIAYNRANAWAVSPAGTPYGSAIAAKAKP